MNVEVAEQYLFVRGSNPDLAGQFAGRAGPSHGPVCNDGLWNPCALDRAGTTVLGAPANDKNYHRGGQDPDDYRRRW